MRVPWTAGRSSQSILKEMSPEYSLEGLMLKLKLQCFGHLMHRAHSSEKTLMLGRIEGGRRRERQRTRWLDASPSQVNPGLPAAPQSGLMGEGSGYCLFITGLGGRTLQPFPVPPPPPPAPLPNPTFHFNEMKPPRGPHPQIFLR